MWDLIPTSRMTHAGLARVVIQALEINSSGSGPARRCGGTKKIVIRRHRKMFQLGR